jgi:dihydroorotate dehydrogenase
MLHQAAQRVQRVVIRTAVGTTVVVGTVEWATHIPSQGRSSQFYHDLVDHIVTPTMRRILDPETAHHAGIFFAEQGLSPRFRPSALEQRCVVSNSVFGKTFPNPIGLAAGFDKDGEVVQEMLDLGFGFVEIGTVTPQAQPGNPKPRMFRLVEDLGIINRYGFNSQGASTVEKNLKSFRSPQPIDSAKLSWPRYIWNFLYPPRHQSGLVGVNIGKNKNSLDAIGDYVCNIRQLSGLADYMVLNISSPNTTGLRDLQQANSLRVLLTTCLTTRNEMTHRVPLLVKLAPDLTDEELDQIANVCLEVGIDGIIITNTTNHRPADLLSKHRGEIGGLSGKPVKDQSTECIRRLFRLTDGKIPIIGVGGVGSGHDAYEKLKAGASLVQVYSMMVYQGPGVISRIRHDLAMLMLENGQRSIVDVIGADHEDIFWRKREERIAQKRRRDTRISIETLPVKKTEFA